MSPTLATKIDGDEVASLTPMLTIGRAQPISKSLSLYIHVPFCSQKCPYCHFFSQVPSEQDFDRYLQALLLEISAKRPDFEQRDITSVYFGGGTPFLLGVDRLCTIIQSIGSCADITKAEITIEANPDSTTKEQLRQCFMAGFNRLSIGAQSFNDQMLKTLRRTHSAARNKEVVFDALEAGFTNISVDLMYDIPDLSHDIWENSLLQAVLLPITHISIYNLEIEPNTAWYRLKRQLAAKMPTQDESLRMYQVAVSTLREHCFEQYEISAFSKNSQRSLHNVGYWIGREFLGLGPAAFSYFQKIRFSNVAHLDQYSFCMTNGQSPIQPESITSTKEELKEFLAIGLRMNDGVHFTSLQDRFGCADNQLLSTIEHLVHIDLLSQDGDHLRLTEKGRLVYDAIASEII